MTQKTNIISSMILTISTLALAIITFFYLCETRKLRLITEKAISIDIAPKVFIQTVNSTVKPNFETGSLEVNAHITIKNSGKTEAKDIKLPYVLSHSSKHKFEDEIGPIQYLFPEQTLVYSTKILSVKVSSADLAVVKQALESEKRINVPKEMVPPIQLDIRVIYNDLQGNKTETPYSFKYLFYKNMWAFAEMKVE